MTRSELRELGKHRFIELCLLAALACGGCVLKAPVPHQPPTAQPPQQINPNESQKHLEGVWENPGRDGKTKRMIFGAGGALTFEGGLGYFNPGHWELAEDRQELLITLPQADDEQLQIFQMYVGDGVKAFNRAQKQVIYPFTAQTWSLNVAGWVYSKTDPTTDTPIPSVEPVFK